MMDLCIDPDRVSGENSDKGAGQGAGFRRRRSKREHRPVAPSVRAVDDSLASRPGRINSPLKRPGRDRRSSGSGYWLGWSQSGAGLHALDQKVEVRARKGSLVCAQQG
jgi:hypothetical protein